MTDFFDQNIRNSKITWINATELPEGIIKDFAELFDHNQSQKLIANLKTEVRILRVNHSLYLPVTINNAELENSYVCSPYNAFVLYAKDELRNKINNKLIVLSISFILSLLGKFLKSCQINRNVHLNNYLLSTNIQPSLSIVEIQDLTRFILREYPTHAIILRSLNEYQHQTLIKNFACNQYALIGSRQVYIFDGTEKDWTKHKSVREDEKRIKKNQFKYINHQEMQEHLKTAHELYGKLYLDKYSKHNPQYTYNFFCEMHKRKLIYFQGYLDHENKLKTFAGVFAMGNTITSPLVGYDTSRPQNEALYIHAMSLIFRHKLKSDRVLNLSSGASDFKRFRGCKPSIEYSAIYYRHLGWYKRSVIKLLHLVANKIGIPLLKYYEL